MRTCSRVTLVVAFTALIVVGAWQALRPRDPSNQGKRLSQWLDEYNRAGALEKTEPISEAIRAMGTNSLPFLLEHIRHSDSTMKKKFFSLLGKLRFLKLPFYGPNRYRSASI